MSSDLSEYSTASEESASYSSSEASLDYGPDWPDYIESWATQIRTRAESEESYQKSLPGPGPYQSLLMESRGRDHRSDFRQRVLAGMNLEQIRQARKDALSAGQVKVSSLTNPSEELDPHHKLWLEGVRARARVAQQEARRRRAERAETLRITEADRKRRLRAAEKSTLRFEIEQICRGYPTPSMEFTQFLALKPRSKLLLDSLERERRRLEARKEARKKALEKVKEENGTWIGNWVA